MPRPTPALRGAIAERDELRDWLEQLTHSDAFMVRDLAIRALG